MAADRYMRIYLYIHIEIHGCGCVSIYEVYKAPDSIRRTDLNNKKADAHADTDTHTNTHG